MSVWLSKTLTIMTSLQALSMYFLDALMPIFFTFYGVLICILHVILDSCNEWQLPGKLYFCAL